jgi:ABC-type lipoprotein export system ATPase subunit
LFETLNDELDQTIVMITHEDWHKKYVDKVIYMKDGLIENVIKNHPLITSIRFVVIEKLINMGR